MTYIRNSRCINEGSAEDFRQNLGVVAAKDEDRVASQCLLSIKLGPDTFSDAKLQVGLTTGVSADELLVGGFDERGLTVPAAGDQLAHDADEVVLRRRLEGLSARQRRVVSEEERAAVRRDLKTLGHLDALSEVVDGLRRPEAGA